MWTSRWLHTQIVRAGSVAVTMQILSRGRTESLSCDYNPRNEALFPAYITRRDDQIFKLVSSGTRKVTFLSISVYNVGIYIADSDISTLNNSLRTLNLTTDSLKDALLSSDHGNKFFESILDNVSVMIRITPVRDTDIAHMRDGFVRGITARCRPDEFALQGFKDSFPNPRTPFKKHSTMLLTVWKPQLGGMQLEIDGHDYGSYNTESARTLLKAFIMTYISGQRVASEPVRQEFIAQILKEVS